MTWTDEAMVSAVLAALRKEAWHVSKVDRASGGTAVTGTRDDLSASVNVFKRDAAGRVNGMVYVSYTRQPPAAVFALVGAGMGALIAALWPPHTMTRAFRAPVNR